ncbi:hypothetical protein VPH35_069782 [Triticum aestivum]
MAVEESGKWMMKSCTAAKSTEAGDQASVRMAAAGSSYMEMEGEQLPEGRIDLSMSTAQEQTGPDRIFFGLFCWAWTGLFSYQAWTVRAGPKWDTSGPQSPLVPSRLTREATAEATSTKILSGGNKTMFRVSAEDVKLILALKRNDLPSIDYLDDLAELYTPDLELFKKIDDDFEVDYDYLEGRKKINAWTKAQWAKIKEDVKITVCAPDADQATLDYIDYVDSEYDDDASSDSEYDDDSESQDED